jgi:hypothetical protein
MICADFMAGANLADGSHDILLDSLCTRVGRPAFRLHARVDNLAIAQRVSG